MNTITIHGNTAVIATINSNEVTVNISSTSGVTYSAQTVTLIEAELDADTLVVHALGTGLTMNSIRATASGNGVTSLISWADNQTTPGLDVTFETPLYTGDFMEWSIGESIPPVKLPVKIVRL